MADPTTPAPAASPAPASAPTQTTPAASPAPASAPVNKPIARGGAGLITNPAPIVDPDAPPAKEELPATVPQSTIDEMAAGRAALQRNKPVATALEEARKAKEDQTNADKA